MAEVTSKRLHRLATEYRDEFIIYDKKTREHRAELAAICDELLAYREGYDPAEREPDLGQWVVVEDMGATPENPGKQVMQWVNTPECVRWFFEDVKGEPGEGDAQVFFVDLVSEWTYRAKSEVKRWYPVGGER